jgi:hypothetical protein
MKRSAQTPQPVPTKAGAERRAIRFGLIMAPVGFILSLAALSAAQLDLVPIYGGLSISRIAGIVVGLTVLATVFYTYLHHYRDVYSQGERHYAFRKWRDTTALAFAYGVVGGGAMVGLGYLFSLGFRGLAFDPYTASALVGLAAGVGAYGAASAAYNIGPNSIIVVLAVVLIGGVLFSMITNTQTDWWKENFSYLGTTDSSRPKAFNFALILGGFVMAALTSFVFSLFDKAVLGGKVANTALRTNILRILFLGAALGIGGVGFFFVNGDTLQSSLHVLSAFIAIAVFIFMIVLLKWLAPTISREFQITSYLMLAGIGLAYFLFIRVGYLSFTAFEMVSFGICFSWLILFLRQINSMSTNARKT